MEALGINLTWFLFQLGNFVLLFAGLTYLLHKPLIKLLDDRRKEVNESLVAAERTRKEVAETEQRQIELLQTARSQASELLRQAKEQAEGLGQQLQAEAQNRAESLLARTQKEIAAEKEQMKEELKGELVDLIIRTSSKVLAEEPLTQKQEHIDKLLREVSS